MGSKVYGGIASNGTDLSGEQLSIEGCENRITYIRDEHDQLDSWHVLGTIDYSKKIFSAKDCENEDQLKTWKAIQEPLIYGEGTLFDDEDHPNAKACAAILRFCNNNDSGMKPGWSIDGAILERRDPAGNPTKDKEKGKYLAKSIATSAAFTVAPCNPKMAGALWIKTDGLLQKSTTPPPAYYEALKKSQSARSFNEIITPEQILMEKMMKLKKSIADFEHAFTSLKCYKCGTPERFFKSGRVPNTCEKCGTHYTVKQIWESLNK